MNWSYAAKFAKYTFFKNFLPIANQKFLIVFTSRTGSNLLAAMLDTHPEILCHHELYNPDGIHRALRYKGSSLSFGTLDERNADPWAFAGRVYAFNGGGTIVGFKLSPGQNDWILLSLLLNRRVKKIITQRQHWLQVYTSHAMAMKTSTWVAHKQAGGTSASVQPSQLRIRVEVGDLLRFIRKRTLFYRLVRLLTIGQSCLWLDYDEMVDKRTADRVLQFLGTKPQGQLFPQTEKQNTARLEDRIENYAELCAALRRTKYAYLCS